MVKEQFVREANSIIFSFAGHIEKESTEQENIIYGLTRETSILFQNHSYSSIIKFYTKTHFLFLGTFLAAW